MTEKEAKDILEEVKILDDSMYQYNVNYLNALDIAIKALEEIQQYREIEAEIKEQYHANVDIKKLMRCFIETIFKGEKHEGFCILTNDDAKMWEKYRAIGTVEECREARERQRGKKRVLDSYYGFNSYECPVCGTEPVGGSNYCHKCGQRLE